MGRIGEGTGVLVGEYNIAIAHSSIVEFFQSNTTSQFILYFFGFKMEFVLFKTIPKSRSVLFTQQFILYFFSYKTVFPPKTIPKS